jgi:hypothetical protein
VGSLLFAMHFSSTVRAVFGASRSGDKASAADFASAHFFRIEDVFFQLRICREDCAAKVFADECVGDRLRTSATLAVIQQEAIAVNIVAAKLDQSPDTASLLGREAEQFSVWPSLNWFHLSDLIPHPHHPLS